MPLRSALPPSLQQMLKQSESAWGWRFRNLFIPTAATVAAWLTLVWAFGGFN